MTLSRRLEKAEALANIDFVAARRHAFPGSGAEWIEVAGASAMYDGVTSPLTQTFGLGLFETVTDADLDRIEAFYREREAPVCHEISPLAASSLLTLLNRRGYHPIELTSVMHRPIDPGVDIDAVRAATLVVRPIGADEHGVWVETAARGWSETPDLGDFMRSLADINVHRKRTVLFLTERDGTPIAAGTLCNAEGVALLGGASTVPEERKQGAQLALLEARLRHAAEQGCDVAMMCAAPGSASQRNAERQGFRIAYTRIKWRLGG